MRLICRERAREPLQSSLTANIPGLGRSVWHVSSIFYLHNVRSGLLIAFDLHHNRAGEAVYRVVSIDRESIFFVEA